MQRVTIDRSAGTNTISVAYEFGALCGVLHGHCLPERNTRYAPDKTPSTVEKVISSVDYSALYII